MAVTVQEVATDLRILADPSQALEPAIEAQLTRHVAVATVLTDEHAPDAPESVKDQAIIVCSAYLYDKPTVSSGGIANAFYNSGAAALLSSWHVERAAVIRGERADG